ncbi:DUF6221 family protein [Streptomyces sp. NPDC051597]|uniref:DUF6221 family protein n=1 Tax=Streptomyces sp. NPDC051597 TaxID=3155049 RepID=UPI0034280163
MDDLVQFLRDRLDEDERTSRLAADETGGTWRAYYKQIVAVNPKFGEDPADANTSEVAAHIARHDPARVLREVEAKRRIVDAYLPPGVSPHPGEPCINYDGQGPAEYDEFDPCVRHVIANERRFHGDYMLRLLALPYADQPGYRKEWRP